MKLRLLPRLVIFDLDHTLWPFGVDTFVFKPPYKKVKDQVLDATGAAMAPFPDSSNILRQLKQDKIDVGIASRTKYPEGANSLIQLFDWEAFIKYKEIYPGSKLTHFDRFQRLSQCKYEDMVFFDDEQRNIDDIGPLGVTAVLLDPKTGMTVDWLKYGFEQFAKSRGTGRR